MDGARRDGKTDMGSFFSGTSPKLARGGEWDACKHAGGDKAVPEGKLTCDLQFAINNRWC